MNKAVAIVCFFAGSIFAVLFLLVFVTKLTRFFSDVRADLVMIAFGLAAFGCYREAGRFWRAPVRKIDRTP